MRTILFAAAVLGSSPVLHAQVAVQQPVIRSIGIGTAVSVPDRGSVFLGGVSSAESFRQSNGPLRTTNNLGYGVSGGSVSASVHIIDLRAMDEAILNSAPQSPVPPTRRSRTVARDDVAFKVDSGPSPAEKAMRFERLAERAEREGRSGVARLHWQMAARYGSAVAPARLKTNSLATTAVTAKSSTATTTADESPVASQSR